MTADTGLNQSYVTVLLITSDEDATVSLVCEYCETLMVEVGFAEVSKVQPPERTYQLPSVQPRVPDLMAELEKSLKPYSK